VKAQHIRKVRQRMKRAQAVLFNGKGEEDHEKWTARMAGLLDVLYEDGGHQMSRKERHAEADASWMLFFSDMPGVCDALVEANQLVVRQRRQISTLHAALRRNGIDLGNLGEGGVKKDEADDYE
jgi:hypothetical protein